MEYRTVQNETQISRNLNNGLQQGLLDGRPNRRIPKYETFFVQFGSAVHIILLLKFWWFTTCCLNKEIN